MRLHRTPLPGVFRIELEPKADARGTFLRTVCRDFLRSQGLVADFPQSNLVCNGARGVLRGLHFQRPPHAEVKLVHCLTGAIHDVVVDLRREQPTYGTHLALELSAERPEVLYVPEGCAHGYQTLAADVLVYYHMSEPYQPGAEGLVRYDDPHLGIAWPVPTPTVSPRDRDGAPYAW
ncbi:MAG: dTDP-4-dehydrorhamnose 3,5-epimerase family protein [Planctomycetota bacterium]